MKSLSDIEHELSKVGIRIRFWGRPELKELANILTDDEHITTAATGRYQGGFALIVTTNHRLLLVDKKLWFMSLEDTRFDMITEVDYSARVFDATISVRTINKVLTFTAMNKVQLRNLARYLQARIMELRQIMLQQSQMPPSQTANYSENSYRPQQNFQYQPAIQFQQAYTAYQKTPPQVLSQTPSVQSYASNIHYTPPSRLRRMGAFPTASFTVTNQRYMTH